MNQQQIFLSKVSFNESMENPSKKIKPNYIKFIKKMLVDYHERYEYLNKRALIWVQGTDSRMNDISSSLTEIIRLSELLKKISVQDPEDVVNPLQVIAKNLRYIDISLPGKSKYDMPDFTFTKTPNNTIISFNKVIAYYAVVLDRYKKIAHKLHSNIFLMYRELHRFLRKCSGEEKITDPKVLKTLVRHIFMELEAANEDPIFTMLDK